MNTNVINLDEPQVLRAGVNERNLFKTMKHIFSTSTTVLAEMMQNSRRAGATKVEFTIDAEARRITVTDDGCGLGDFNNLLQLCESGWNESVMLTDSPFGMGFFSVFFACDQVVVRSRGKRMAANLDDIQSKRALLVIDDEQPVQAGTVIEMHGVAQKLFEPRVDWMANYSKFKHPTLNVEAAHALVRQASGFPIPVFVNGAELKRPFALANLKTTVTAVGHIHVPGIHDGASLALPKYGSTNPSLFLQGLPIARLHDNADAPCVHLDPTVFAARVPDRTSLFDHQAQETKINQAVMNLVRQHLVQMKASLDAEEFVRRYFRSCISFGIPELLNDVPFLPLSSFQRVVQVRQGSEEVWTGAARESESERGQLVTRQQFVTGELVAWSNAPVNSEDGTHAPGLLKVMQIAEILSLSDALDPGHWLYELAPSCHDLEVRVAPVNPGARGNYNWNADCEVVVVERVDVEVTSHVDPDYRFWRSIEDGWILVNKDGREAETFICDRPMVCYLTASGNGDDHGHPVFVFSDYCDEGEVYREEWQSSAQAAWDSLVSGLLGHKLAEVLKWASGDLTAVFSSQHQQQLALVSVHGGYAANLHFHDMGDMAMWERVASGLQGKELSAQALQEAFFEAQKVKKD